jgi:Uma2 family endonuclease
MSTETLITAEEYLAASYHPDCDYVDGVLIQRNVGTKDHSNLQAELLAWFRERRRQFGLKAFPEQRIQVSAWRYRVPDVCVVALPEPDEQVFSRPPFICIEILSPEDSFPRLQDRIDDYRTMGVPNIWIMDPTARRAWTVAREGLLEALDGILRSRDGRVALPLADLYSSDE